VASAGLCKVCTSSQTTTPTSHHSVFAGRMPFLPPNQQRQSTEGRSTEGNGYRMDLVTHTHNHFTALWILSGTKDQQEAYVALTLHIIESGCPFPLPFSRHNLSYDDCLEIKREGIRTILCCIMYNICTQRYRYTHVNRACLNHLAK